MTAPRSRELGPRGNPRCFRCGSGGGEYAEVGAVPVLTVRLCPGCRTELGARPVRTSLIEGCRSGLVGAASPWGARLSDLRCSGEFFPRLAVHLLGPERAAVALEPHGDERCEAERCG